VFAELITAASLQGAWFIVNVCTCLVVDECFPAPLQYISAMP
jgi:hypothetical protein